MSRARQLAGDALSLDRCGKRSRERSLSQSVADDLDILAKTIHGEARSEPFEGALAVAWVVLNRVRLGIRGSSVRDVCLARMQFSCWNQSDPNLRVIATTSPDADPSFLQAVAAAACAMSHSLPDPTGGATDYHTTSQPASAAVWPPGWAADYTPTVRLGAHSFYRRA